MRGNNSDEEHWHERCSMFWAEGTTSSRKERKDGGGRYLGTSGHLLWMGRRHKWENGEREEIEGSTRWGWDHEVATDSKAGSQVPICKPQRALEYF